MDAGEIFTVTAILVGFVAVLIGIFALMWQMHSQGGRLDAKIDAQGDRLATEIRAQGTEIKAQSGRISEAEREQARLEGVNSVLRIQTHTHEAADD